MYSFLKYLLKGVCFLLIIVTCSLALLPTIVSTDWGRKQLVHWVNESIPGKIEIHSLDLNWFNGQALEGVTLKDPEGQVVFEIEKFSTRGSLWQILRKCVRLGFTQIKNLNAFIVTHDTGETNLQRALGISSKKEQHSPLSLASTIFLSNLNADFYLFEQGHPLSFFARGETKQQNLEGSFEIKLSLENLYATHWEEFIQEGQSYLNIEKNKKSTIQAKIINFPVDLIDSMTVFYQPNLNGFFRSLLGDRLNVAIDRESSNEGLAFKLMARSPLMRGDFKGKISQGLLTFETPGRMEFLLSPQLLSFSQNSFKLLHPSKLQVTLANVSFPLAFLDKEQRVDPCLFAFKAECVLSPSEFQIGSMKRGTLTHFQMHLNAPLCEKLMPLQIIAKGQIAEEPFDIKMEALIDKPTHFLQFQKEWEAHLFLQAPQIALKETKFQIGKEMILRLNLADLSAQIGGKFNIGRLESPFLLTIDPFSTPLKGKLSIDRFFIGDMLVREIRVPWIFDKTLNTLALDLKGIIDSKIREKPSQLAARIQLHLQEGYYDIGHTKAEVHANVADLPTSLISQIIGSPDLRPLLGPIIDLNLKTFIDPTFETPGYCNIVLDSSLLHFNANFNLNHTATLLDPIKIPNFRLTVTPESFDYLKQLLSLPEKLKLAAPTILSASLSKFQLPLKEFLLERGFFNFDFSTTDIQWRSLTSPIRIEGKIASANLLEKIQFSLQANGNSSLTLEGAVTHFFNFQGKLKNRNEMELQARIEGKQLTRPFLQGVFFLPHETTQKLEALLGESIELNANCTFKDLNSFIQGEAKGAYGKFLFDGKIKQGVFTLNKPLESFVTLTPAFTQTFLVPYIPLLSSTIGSENPIKLTIDPAEFACPLFPFDLSQIKLGSARIDLGKIHFRNEGELLSILSFVHTIPNPTFIIWFTPIHFKINNGILELKRFDMLIANSYTLANWGKINLIQNVGDFVLGLTGQTLEYAFGIQGLGEKYLVQVPLHIENGKGEIDKKKATKILTALVARSRIGEKGQILGNLLGAVFLNTEEATAPPPTTEPFPWEGEFTSPTPKATQTHFRSENRKNGEKKKKKKKKKLMNLSLIGS